MYLHSTFAQCLCGVFPISIIAPKLIRKYPRLQLSKKQLSFNASEQQIAWQYMKLASERLLNEAATQTNLIVAKIASEAQYFPREKLQQLCGLGSIEGINKALIDKEITSEGNNLIIPNLIASSFISGFWIIDGTVARYKEILKGGLCFGFTIFEPQALFEYIFVFQNVLSAILYILDCYHKFSVIPPIVAHPTLNIIKDVFWLLGRKLILVVNDLQPTLYKHLLPFKPYIVRESKKRFFDSVVTLKKYTVYRQRLDSHISEIIGLSPGKGIIITKNGWYYYPSMGKALSVNIVISKIYRYKTSKLYVGQIMIPGKEKHITFYIKGERNFYKKLNKICTENDIELVCSKPLRKELLRIALTHSRVPIKQVILGYDPLKNAFVFPKFIVTTEIIKRAAITFSEDNIPGKKLIKKNVVNVKLEPDYSEESTINHLGVFLSIALLIANQTTRYIERHYCNKTTTFIYTEFNEFLEHVFGQFGIPVFRTDTTPEWYWPTAYDKYPIKTIHEKKYSIVTTGTILDIGLTIIRRKTCIFVPTGAWLPFLNDSLTTKLVLEFTQFVLRAKNINPEVNERKVVNEFIKKLNIPASIYDELKERLKFVGPSFSKGFAIVLAQLLKLNMISTRDLRFDKIQRVNIVSIKKDKINGALINLGYDRGIIKYKDKTNETTIPIKYLDLAREQPLSLFYNLLE